MTTSRTLRGSLALAVCVAALQPAQTLAQEGGLRGGSFTVGLFGFQGDTAYGFTETAAVPFVEYENDHFKIGVPSVDVKLPWISSEQLSFGLTVDFFGGEGGYEAGDAPILNGMADRDGGVWAGATMGWRSDLVDLSFAAMTDVTGDSDGSSFKLEASRSFVAWDRLMITPKLAAVWLDDNAVDYYYGVRAGEATASRAQYSGSSTVNVEGGITFGYMLAERHMLLLDLGVTKLGSGIADSPIVVDDMLTKVGLGYVFKF
ncbi:MipA/OmpV family protein [Fertoebacter nigrum]|uniref:MipA/OmpV family protein n=1 Tax=Fertoeibacter niger TaxID=2656921 RepID=A0A8X8KNH5_9RHOB|nr:MipA/OmpV family protein [Fertoeibacter niger]NUB45005.1 MipA/OmpV family protein [Fertoeibacter niger]